MLTAGVDVGQHSVKVVVLEGNRVAAQGVHVTEEDSDTAARWALEAALSEAGLSLDRVGRVVSTGLGRKEVSFAQARRTQETCVARGAFHLLGRECTVLDAGAGGCRAVRMGPGGKVLEFAGNSKCAAGTGSFLEAACEVLQVDLEQLDAMAVRAGDVARVSTTCAVFAESAIISNVHYGYSIESICAGICESVVSRLADVLSRAGGGKDLFFCGGVARSKAIGRMLGERTGTSVHVPDDPFLVTALGAALSGA